MSDKVAAKSVHITSRQKSSFIQKIGEKRVETETIRQVHIVASHNTPYIVVCLMINMRSTSRRSHDATPTTHLDPKSTAHVNWCNCSCVALNSVGVKDSSSRFIAHAQTHTRILENVRDFKLCPIEAEQANILG